MLYHNVKIEKLVNQEQLDSLWDLYCSLSPQYAFQDYNLFSLEKTEMDRSTQKNNPGIRAIDEYAFETLKVKTHSHYFLNYSEWSYARLHEDNKEIVTKTIITVIDKSNDLIGGETLILDKHFDLPQPVNSYCKRLGSNHGSDIVPCIVPSEVGTSMIYDWNVKHAVTQVRKGNRTVLVSWYHE